MSRMQIPSIDVLREMIDKNPHFKISVLADESNSTNFCENVIGWLVSEVNRHQRKVQP